MRLLLFLVATLLCPFTGAHAQLNPYPYLLHYVCPDFGPPWTCPSNQLNIQRAMWPMAWRKHDLTAAPPPGAGQQINDSALADDGQTVISAMSFAPFNPKSNTAIGDGGVIIGVGYIPGKGWTARGIATQDSGTPMQYFCGDGWVYFRETVPLNAWAEEVVNLSIASDPSLCTVASLVPSLLRSAHTTQPMQRWWNGVETVTPMDIILSEHYDGPTIAASTYMEKTIFAADLGMVRWEAWESPTGIRPIVAGINMPVIANDAPPAPGWYEYNGRDWLNVISTGFSVNGFGWGLSIHGP